MEKIFWSLFNADSELEVDKVLKNNSVLDNPVNWMPYGDTTGNFGTFENQSPYPVLALVEKITNSIDAILIKECRLKGIDPTSVDAPRTMGKAVELFYKVKDGEIGELLEKERRVLSENIQIIAVGDKSQPSLIVYDCGEGQTPDNFENTFLSLHKNNKTKIHFVQGKYNMGSTGAVVFCGTNKYQLIGSKRCAGLEKGDTDFGFTLVRRHPLTKEEDFDFSKASWYEFFSPNKKIPCFKIKELDFGLYNRKFTYGSIVKLYSYQLPAGSRSDITLDLWRDLNQYMYHLPLPISVYEKRYSGGNSPSKPVLGNRTRIMLDSRDNVDTTISYNIPKEAGFGEVPIVATVFNTNVDHNEFIKHKSIIFTQNGQVHGFEGQSFISQDLGYSLLKKHLLIHVDCTDIPTSIRQDLFMANRTHLKHGPKLEKLREIIIDVLKKSAELKRINNERKNSLLHESESDKDLIENLLSKLPIDKDVLNLLKKDGSLSFLKRDGQRVRGSNGVKNEQKQLNRFPSVFKLKINEDGKPYKTIPLNSQGQIEIETDVENDYLFRPAEKGKFVIEVLQYRPSTDYPIIDKHRKFPNITTDILNINREGPINGTIKLLIKPNEKAKVGDEVTIRTILSAPGQDLECVFQVKVDKEINEPKKKEKKSTETFPNLPTPHKAFENSSDDKCIVWSDPQLGWGGYDIVKVITAGDDAELMVDSIIVNMDSFVLKSFLSKNRIESEKEIIFIKDKYFASVYLHSLFLFSILQKMRKDDEKLHPIEVDEFVSSMVKPYASFLMYENHHITKLAFGD